MKKILLTLAILFIYQLTMASGIKFIENKKWEALIALAKKENKLIFLDAYATWCGPCQYLQNSVFTDKSVGSYFNDSFINVKIDMEEGEGPDLAEQFGVTAYPTLFFIDGDGKLVHKFVGALEPEELVNLGKDASNPETQYFTSKAKAVAGELEPTAFHTWIHAAEKLEDEELEDITSNYLNSGSYSLLNKEILNIIFEHSGSLSEKLLTDLVNNKARIMEIREMSETDFNASIRDKAISTALAGALKDDVLDFKLYRQVLDKYCPNEAALETQKMKVNYYVFKEEFETALNELSQLIGTASFKLPASDLSYFIATHYEKIEESGRSAEFISKVEKFRLLPAESELLYHKNFAILLLYKASGDMEKYSIYKERVLSDEFTPEGIKSFLDEEN